MTRPRSIQSRAWAAPSLFISAIASAQCAPAWEALSGGLTFRVGALASWDPDGPGPAAPLLIAGGNQSTTVMAWDGASWSPLGPSGGVVTALLVFNGDLIAASGLEVRRWDGSSWLALGVGLSDFVQSLGTDPEGRLVAGTGPIGPVSRLEGGVWRRLVHQTSNYGYAVLAHRGELVVAGAIEAPPGTQWGVAHWTGSVLAPLGNAPPPLILAMTEHGGDLFVATQVIHRWDGSTWRPFAQVDNGVGAMLSLGGEFFVGGQFSTIDGVSASHIARFDGSRWSALGQGLGGSPASVRALIEHQGDLIVAGRFDSAGGAPASNIARWRCAPCYSNCDRSPAPATLNVNDFVCFQSRFAAADPYADCNHDLAFNVYDFICFQQSFAAGCP